ncbi:MAG TPA: hypothetical protein VG757_16190 [Devosia sp.]|nr:hypothetical protein [Devosia sp.]
MTRFKAPGLLSLALLACLPLIDAAEGATVRRHVDCSTFGLPLQNPFTGGTFPGSFQVTNNWSFAIPSGTQFSVTYHGHTSKYTTTSDLAAGGQVAFGSSDVSTTGDSCNASFPDPGYGAGGKTNKFTGVFNKVPNAVFSTN